MCQFGDCNFEALRGVALNASTLIFILDVYLAFAIMQHMVTRIYQGKVVRGCFINQAKGEESQTDGVLFALKDTHVLFQDAVNYHLVALAGMAQSDDLSIRGKFRAQVKALWDMPESYLKKSLCRTFGISSKDVSFEDIVNKHIFAGCKRMDILPYVLQFIIEKTKKEDKKNNKSKKGSDGKIRDQGKDLLPKICKPNFSGNFDYSSKGRESTEKYIWLRNELKDPAADKDFTEIALSMDLSWVGIKTQTGKYKDKAEIDKDVEKAKEEIITALRNKAIDSWKKLEEGGRDLAKEVEDLTRSTKRIENKLARNNKCSMKLKGAAILFMFYPCRLSADLLLAMMPEKKQEVSDLSELGNDPLILARGKRGYIYRGFTALSHLWSGVTDGDMYEIKWDRLSFIEALKAFHGFVLKTAERENERLALECKKSYIEGKLDKTPKSDDNDEDENLKVLGGDPRFDALNKLVDELRKETMDSDYSVSQRALRGKKEIIGKWKQAVAKGHGSEAELHQILLEELGRSESKGSHDLFAALCKEEYQCIWRDEAPNDGKNRAEDVLECYSQYQELVSKIDKLKRSVRVSAAHPIDSPRALTYSDLKGFFGKETKVKGFQFETGKQGALHLGVVVKNAQGQWVTKAACVTYSAPRLERDNLGTDPAHWLESKKSKDVYPWLQPMMKALDLDENVLLNKEPAITLAMKEGSGCNPEIFLNFPVELNEEPVKQAIGKAARWQNQFNAGRHLNWAGTLKKGSAWYENGDIKQNGFDILSVDLGLRQAAAWNLTHVQLGKEWQRDGARCEGRCIGGEWYGFPYMQGFIRVNGEGKTTDTKMRAPLGIRYATDEEIDRANSYMRLEHEKDVIRKGINILDLNYRYLRHLRKKLNKYSTLNSYLRGLRDTERREQVCRKAMEAKSWYDVLPALGELLEKREIGAASTMLEKWLMRERPQLIKTAEKVTNLVLPRKHGEWKWDAHVPSGQKGGGSMAYDEAKCASSRKKIYHAGGISIARIAQIEKLRHHLQALGHLLAVEPGEAMLAKRSDEMQDPCPQIRTKIENMREARVNEIAHAIVAQALGVRLKPSNPLKNINGRDIIHGEYEQIPGRKPVDFVVLENLSSYKTNISQKRNENSALMLWAHRQLTAKIQQLLEEVFGIPVLYAHAPFTSRFDSMTSAPGFRPERLNQKILDKWNTNEKADDKTREIYRVYEKLYRRLPQNVYLYIPSNKGEYFVAAPLHGQVPILRNADKNAAVNIGWRALAAPERVDLLHIVRLQPQKKGESYKLYKNNKREKAYAAWRKDKGYQDHFRAPAGDKGKETRCFYLPSPAPDGFHPIQDESGVGLCMYGSIWGVLERKQWLICHKLNEKLLRKAGLNTLELEHLIKAAIDDLPL